MKTKHLSCGKGMRFSHVLTAMLTLLVILLPSQAKADDEAWAEYNSTETTLTFMYGEKPTSLDEGVTAYALNEGAAIPQWNTDNTCSSVTKVVFASSFAQCPSYIVPLLVLSDEESRQHRRTRKSEYRGSHRHELYVLFLYFADNS